MDETPLELDVALTTADMIALTRQVRRKSGARLILLVLILTSLLAGWLVAARVYPHADFMPLLVALDTGLVVFLVLVLSFRGVIFRKAYGPDSYFFEPRRYVIDAKGVGVTTTHTNGFFGWPAIASAEKSREHLFLMLAGKTQAHVIPFRCLPAALRPEDAFARIESWRAAPHKDS